MSVDPSWKQKTIARLARDIGALAEILVDDVVFDLCVDEAGITPRQLMSFIARLQREIPETVDARPIIRELMNDLLPTANS